MTDGNEKTTHEKKPGGGISIRVIGAVAIVIAILLAFHAFTLASAVSDIKGADEAEEMRYVQCSEAVDTLQMASDYLTTQARVFVVTGREDALRAYVDELTVNNRRGNAVEKLNTNLSDDREAFAELEQALATSDELAQSELVALRLAADYYRVEDLPDKVAKADVDAVAQGLSQDEKIALARKIMLGEEYDAAKQAIREKVEASSSALLESLDSELEANEKRMQGLLFQLRISVALLLCTIMVLVLVVFMYVLKPLARYNKLIEKNEPLEADGAYELRYLANAYNAMYEDNSKRIEQLRDLAERDKLTGLSNRSGYDSFLATHTRNIALILIDIDNFKDFNIVYGRDTGDAVMVKLAKALATAFRSTDFPCRIESDKFAVIMTNMSEGLRDAVNTKMELVNSLIADDSDDLPLITLSVGAAFSAEGMDDHDIYHAASMALEQAQARGRNSIVFYGESNEA